MEANNMAAMREALGAFVEYSELVCRMGMFNRDNLVAITTKARAALSAPPRNCDRTECNTPQKARITWRSEDGGRSAYADWLLATAEQEGGAK